MSKEGTIIVLSGFSGAGKGTIMKHLITSHKDKYFLSVSATTRNKREGEEDGREYFFKTKEEFEEMIRQHEFLEFASFNDNYYGTPRAYVEKLLNEGKDILLEIEVNGALQVKKVFPKAILVFVTPKSADVLKKRLYARGTEDNKVINERLKIAGREALLIEQYDYILVNDILEDAVHNLHNIIQSEKNKVIRQEEFINNIQEELFNISKGENDDTSILS